MCVYPIVTIGIVKFLVTGLVSRPMYKHKLYTFAFLDGG